MGELPDNVWLVTGASAGFGWALCEEILARKGRLVATARNPSALKELVRRSPDRVLAARLDVTNPADITSAVAAGMERFGRIDVLINNAGYGLMSAVEEASDEEIRAQFEVNFFGLAAVTRSILPIFRKQRSGAIVNLSSGAGLAGAAGAGFYNASKFAVEGLSEALAKELAPFGVRVMIVEPSAFRTEFFGRSLAGPARPIADYKDAAELRAMFQTLDGAQAGDPQKAAVAMIEAIMSPAPPMRLVLGKAAFDLAMAVQRARAEDFEKSRTIAPSVDFPA